MSIKISVIMSVYNDENKVSSAIESILSQSYKNFEFLILDDYSSDNTKNVIAKYIYDSRVKIFRNKKNLGLTKSLNKLINISQGKYIFRQDADDISLRQRFEKQIKILETKNVKVCTTRAINLKNNKIIPGASTWIPKKITIKYKNPYIHGTLAIDKTFLNSLGNYSEEFYYSQDFKLYVDIFKRSEKIYEIKEPLYCLNTYNNISTNYRAEQNFYFKKALGKNG